MSIPHTPAKPHIHTPTIPFTHARTNPHTQTVANSNTTETTPTTTKNNEHKYAQTKTLKEYTTSNTQNEQRIKSFHSNYSKLTNELKIEIIPLLGVISDSKIAKKYNLQRGQLRLYRKSISIEPYTLRRSQMLTAAGKTQSTKKEMLTEETKDKIPPMLNETPGTQTTITHNTPTYCVREFKLSQERNQHILNETDADEKEKELNERLIAMNQTAIKEINDRMQIESEHKTRDKY